MIYIVLVTGFLGSGKTTLMKSILYSYNDKRVGVIINDFGRINIDALLIKRDGIEMAEVSNGSIFCACLKESFINCLIEMSRKNIEYLFIEASGLADPSTISEILEAIKPKLSKPYNYRGNICIVDSENFLQLYDLLPALHRQIEYASAAIINKRDLVDIAVVDDILKKINSINTSINMYITSYCQIDIIDVIKNMSSNNKDAKESTNILESRPKTVILSGYEKVSYEQLKKFLEAITPFTYRIKGFVKTDRGVMEISSVGININLNSWNKDVDKTEIVVISSIGIKIISIITKTIEAHLKGKIFLQG